MAVVCALVGAGLAYAAWLWPSHLEAVDTHVLRAAGGKGWAAREAALDLVRQNHVTAAALVRQAAQEEKLPGADDWNQLFSVKSPEPPMTDWFIHAQNREDELARMAQSKTPAVRQLLQTRKLTDTRLFAPSSSAAGQAYDAAVAITGYLIDNGNVAGSLRDAIGSAAASANAGGGSEPLERILLDFLSLGQRLDRDEAGIFVNNIQSVAALSVLAEEARAAGPKLPALFAAVALSGQPGAVASYLQDYNKTGLSDLAASLRYGSGGVIELLHRHQRLYGAPAEGPGPLGEAIDNLCLREPAFALSLKCLLWLLAGFFLAQAWHFAAPSPSARQRPLEVKGARYARECLFALGFLAVALMLSEPFLAQQSQKLEIRLRLPTVGGPAAPGTTSAHPKSFMNNSNATLLTLLLFFVLQALIYIACLVKLSEIKRQNAVARVKLKLLENEEHLFDAGLYLGFCGTIVSLILASLSITGWSLMAAYSSTSFGIIFVSIFKIFQLRPVRRELLLQSEEDRLVAGEAEIGRPSLATMP